MFGILGKSLSTGIVTTKYPAAPPKVSIRARGRPEIDWTQWKDARPAAAACPTGAISFQDAGGHRTARFDLAQCIFCGLCVEADPAIRMTNRVECAARDRASLISAARYKLGDDGAHRQLVPGPAPVATEPARPPAPAVSSPLESIGR
ncbi:MAG TPA: hypothetical protein P5022_18640, partial [Candidatus Paceibacterota bacterium]|nr:hypothetical protein [Candidatus Paceibacterota bacterium]